jgi:actin-related protein 5
MAPSATEPQAQASQPETALPPPHLYTPRESRFEKFVEVQEDGYRQAKSRGNQAAAIVIDNGRFP